MKKKMGNDDLTPEEQSAFKSLVRESKPPNSLERKTVDSLKAEGLLHHGGNTIAKWVLYPIAASVVFILGFLVGNNNDTINKDQAYMLVLFEDENFRVENPADAAVEYGLWSDEVNHSGVKMEGQELWNEAYRITNDGIEKLAGEHDNRITGYFVLQAGSTDEAIAVARDSPHVKYGGVVQLKQFRVR